MNYRKLGRTGLAVSEVGFGTWGIGNTSWVGADKRSSVQALIAAYDEGINFFDTAWVYGRGQSERLLARVFGKSSTVVIASKVPPRNGAWPAVPGIPLREVFPLTHVMEYLRKTVRNLRREAVDLYQFHVWNDEWIRDPDWPEMIENVRRSGRARFIGISINDHQPENVLAALKTGMIDTVQVIYNIFDQSPEARLFPYCERHGIGVIARVPFDEGGLTGNVRPDTTFPERDFRNRYFEGNRKREVWERVLCMAEEAGIAIEQMPNLALRFCFSTSAVSTVIAGMRKASHVRMNAAASEEGPLSEALLRMLREHRWVRNYYPPPTVRSAASRPESHDSSSLRILTRMMHGKGQTGTFQ